MHMYINDWLIVARNTEKVKRDVLITLDLCRQLELKVNLVKSELTPTQDFVFLGYHYKLASGMVYPPSRRMEDLRAVIGETLSNSLSLGSSDQYSHGEQGLKLMALPTCPCPQCAIGSRLSTMFSHSQTLGVIPIPAVQVMKVLGLMASA